MFFLLILIVIWTEFRDYKRRKNRANLFTHFRLRESVNSTDSFVDDTDIVEFVKHNKSLDLRMSKVNWLSATYSVYLSASFCLESSSVLLIYLFKSFSTLRMLAAHYESNQKELMILFIPNLSVSATVLLFVECYIWLDSRY
jgi:hypothetical protein